MSVIYQITGYDRKTERLATEQDVPEHCLGAVLRIAGVDVPDLNLDCRALTAQQVNEIATLIGQAIYRADLDFFIEPVATGALC